MSGGRVLGEKELLAKIEAKLGKARRVRIENKALRNTADQIVLITKEAVEYYKLTGATYDEVVRSNVKGASLGIKSISIGWRGDMSRWRLVHLNEFGYTRFGQYVRPAGMGAVQRAADKSKEVAYRQMLKGLEELAK